MCKTYRYSPPHRDNRVKPLVCVRQLRFLLEYLESTMTDGSALVVLCTSVHGAAQIIQARLEDHGIPTALSYESAGVVYGLTVDGLGEVRILVPQAYYEQARAVLAESYDAESDGPEDPV